MYDPNSTKNLNYHGINVLNLLKELLQQPEFSEKRGRITKGITKKEVVTKADLAAEELVIDYIKENKIPVNLDGEEKRRSILTQTPEGLWTLDPIDGTYNYFRGLFAYVSILSMFDYQLPKI